MPLNARQVETAQPKDKEYKLTDERGLYLLVKPNGSKYWRLKYRIAGKEKKLAIGVYPDFSLADARLKRDEARKMLTDGLDPSQQKQLEKQAQKITTKNTFHTLALKWHAYKSKSRSEGYAESVQVSALSPFYCGRTALAGYHGYPD